MAIASFIINSIRTVFSWPIVLLIILLVLLCKYHKSISYFIENIKSVKAPGGIEVIQKLEENKVEDSIKTTSNNRQIEINVNEINEQFNEIINASLEKDKIIEISKDAIFSLIEMIKDYHFKYLNLFFVAGTKTVLLWFSQANQVTKDFYKLVWSPIIKNEEQVEIVLNVLLMNSMIEDKGNSFIITELGKEFLKYSGLKK
ncbi:MAG: hypothetical protein ACYDIA_07665 [Candidatus Humimicrobiaceae bacterium]